MKDKNFCVSCNNRNIKVAERENCEFKTADNTYYDASNSLKPLVATSKKALKDAQSSGTDGQHSFQFKARIDEEIGTLRVNDLGYENSLSSERKDKNSIEELEQLYAFVNNKKIPAVNKIICNSEDIICEYKRGDNLPECNSTTGNKSCISYVSDTWYSYTKGFEGRQAYYDEGYVIYNKDG